MSKYLLNSLIGITLLLVLFSFVFIIHDAKKGITGYTIIEDPDCQNNFEHYLKFFQVRFGWDLGPMYPERKVELTLGDYDDLGDIEGYLYATITNIKGNVLLYTDPPPYDSPKTEDYNVMRYAVGLTRDEANSFADEDSRIIQAKVQKADIEKIHKEMFGEEAKIAYGVVLDSNGDPILEDSLHGVPEFTIENRQNPNEPNYSYYQEGKTIVIPPMYTTDPTRPDRFFFNLNNPAVREYLVRFISKRMESNKYNTLFLDNMGVFTQQLRESNYYLDPLVYYVSKEGYDEQADILVNYQLDILREIKARNSGIKIIVNGVRDGHPLQIMLHEELRKQENLDLADGFILEIEWWSDKYCTNVEFYRDWIEWTNTKNKKILFAATDWDGAYDFSASSSVMTDIWLWLHLVAEDNMYSYFNPNYSAIMVDYDIYDYPLGNPLESPYKEGDTWYREYERGEIVFNISSGKLDSIELIESCPTIEQTCQQAGYTCVSSCNGAIMNYNCSSGICCRTEQEQTCEDSGYYCVAESNCSSGDRRSYNCDFGVCCSKLPTINLAINVSEDKTCLEQSGKICNSTQYCNGTIGWTSDGNCCLGECVEEETTEPPKEPNNLWFYWFIGGIVALIFGVVGYILYEVNRGKW